MLALFTFPVCSANSHKIRNLKEQMRKSEGKINGFWVQKLLKLLHIFFFHNFMSLLKTPHKHGFQNCWARVHHCLILFSPKLFVVSLYPWHTASQQPHRVTPKLFFSLRVERTAVLMFPDLESTARYALLFPKPQVAYLSTGHH